MGRLVYLKTKMIKKQEAKFKKNPFCFLQKKIAIGTHFFYLSLCQNVTFHFNFLCDQLTILYTSYRKIVPYLSYMLYTMLNIFIWMRHLVRCIWNLLSISIISLVISSSINFWVKLDQIKKKPYTYLGFFCQLEYNLLG